MVEQEARHLANEWSDLHDGRWRLAVDRTPDSERLVRVALRRHIQALLPDDGLTAGVLETTESPLVVAVSGARLFLASVVKLEPNEAPEIEVRSLPLVPERCELTASRVRIAQIEEMLVRKMTWRLRVDGEEVAKFITTASLEDPRNEALPRVTAAVIGWHVPNDFAEVDPLRAA
jgi:hypothetical protein